MLSMIACLIASTPLLAQLDATPSISGTAGGATSGSYLFASSQGRTLQAQGWTLSGQMSSRVLAWYGRQGLLAKGRYAGDEFSASADRFGLRAVLQGSEDRGLLIQYDGYRSGSGISTGPNSSAARPGEVTRVQFPGGQTDILALQYSLGAAPAHRRTTPSLPTYQLRASLSSVRVVGRSARVLGLGGGVLFPIRPWLTGSLGMTGYWEGADGLTSAPSAALKPYLTAGLTVHPARWAALNVGLDVMPMGMPFGGTSLSSLSGFLLYQSSGATAGLERSTFADLHVQLQISSRF
jgi:hypothetical protein